MQIHTVGPRHIGPIGTFISGLPLKRGRITLNTIIWDLKMLTFIDGEPLRARLLLRGSTVITIFLQHVQKVSPLAVARG